MARVCKCWLNLQCWHLPDKILSLFSFQRRKTRWHHRSAVNCSRVHRLTLTRAAKCFSCCLPLSHWTGGCFLLAGLRAVWVFCYWTGLGYICSLGSSALDRTSNDVVGMLESKTTLIRTTNIELCLTRATTGLEHFSSKNHQCFCRPEMN